MKKPFFFRIEAGALLDFATDPEGEGITLLRFAKDLQKGESDIPFIQQVIDEARGFIEKKANAGKKGMKNRWLSKNEVDNSVITVLSSVITNDNTVITNDNTPITSSSSSSSSSKERKDKNTCPEQSSGPSFLLNDGSLYHIPEKKLAEWVKLYEYADVEKELQKLKEWCEVNPKRRKTRDGALRFCCSWLNKADNSVRGKYEGRDNLLNMEIERVIRGC
jgi:hypothetical protein